MTIAVYLPLLACAGLAMIAPTASRRLPAGVGLWTLVAAAAIGAVASIWSLVLLAVVLVDDIPAYDSVETRVPVPDIISFAALAWLLFGAGGVLLAARRVRHDMGALRRLATEPGLVIAEVASADAFAIPAPGLRGEGTVYVTSGMLKVLNPAQQRALLAHEWAHLVERHAAARTIGVYAAAANPMLAPVREAIGYLCERHADEIAAGETGSRSVVARAVAAAALARSTPITAAAMHLHRLGVTDRVTALLAPRPSWRRWQLALLGVAIVACAAGASEATHDFAVVADALRVRW
jgi:Zn-dependent protease with chaperone function